MSELHAEQDIRQQERAAAIGECREAFLYLISEALRFTADTDVDDHGNVYNEVHLTVDARALKEFMADIGMRTAWEENPYEALKSAVG